MANYFELNLDTTGPNIEVYSPGYAVKSGLTEMEIKANERLSKDHDFYFIDSDGKKHNVIFKYNGDSFIGEVDFSNFADGISIFYGQVKDEVFNLSPVVTHSILVHKGEGAAVQVMDMDRFMIIESHDRSNQIEGSARNIKTNAYSKRIETMKSIRHVEVETYE